MIAFVVSERRDGWCRIISSIALPKLLAVLPAITIIKTTFKQNDHSTDVVYNLSCFSAFTQPISCNCDLCMTSA